METLLTQIREAMKDNASAEARNDGILACKTILAALETAPGQPMAGANAATGSTASQSTSSSGASQGPAGQGAYQPFPTTSGAGQVSPLDMIIAQLVSQLGSQNQNQSSNTESSKPSGLRIPFVPLATMPLKKGA